KDQERLVKMMRDCSIGPVRADFVGRQTMAQYYQTHLRFDIALDPFPYNGGATTCDALWMGAPVVSYSAKLPASRAGKFFLTVIGLGELVADSVDDYVRIASELARDVP